MILGPIAKVLGYLMNGIFILLDKIGIPSIGLSIIIFTIVIYLLLMPLTIKQQKFSKLSSKMNPEIQAIQAKYKDKRDTDSQMAMQQETKAVYAKYGVSPSGSCVQLLIQMPILFALYRVIYSIPAYVTKVGDTFRVLAEKIVGQDGGQFILNASADDMKSVASAVKYSKNLADTDNITNGIIDVLNKVSSSDMVTLADKYGLSDLTFNGQKILSTLDASGNVVSKGLIDTYNTFLGLNIANSPQFMFTNAWSDHKYLLCFVAILIPLLSAATQWLNVKLMPQAGDNNAGKNADGNDTGAAMQQSMKTMNMMMPLMSAFFCFTLPIGMGIYWIAGSLIRTAQQIFINKHIDKMDIDEIIKKNEEKAKKKIEKNGVTAQKMQQYAAMNTRSLSERANIGSNAVSTDSDSANAANTTAAKPSPGSLTAKANMVKEYNERNNK